MKPLYQIEFNPIAHVYTVSKYVDGALIWEEVKRSVTQVLEYHGLTDSSWIKPYYLDRGTQVHLNCVLFAQGWLDWDAVRGDCLEFVRRFKVVCLRLGLTYISAEVPCYDPEYGVCGTFDLIMGWRGKRVLVELKTGPFEMHHGLQLASYERMVDVDDVMGISLKDGKVWVKDDDWECNHKTLNDIHTGFFDLDTWKANRNRRHMKVLKGEA